MSLFIDIILFSIALICRTRKDLTKPVSELPANASRGAAYAGLSIGVILFSVSLVWGVVAMVSDSQAHGQYGTINGVPISRADYEACGGNIPDGCPGGATGMINKYASARR